MVDASAGNLAYHLQPTGRTFLKTIATKGALTYPQWDIFAGNRIVAELREDKNTRYTFQGADVCQDPDIKDFIKQDEIHITDLELKLVLRPSNETAEVREFVFSLNADTLLVSGADIGARQELIRVADIQALNTALYGVLVEFLCENYVDWSS